MKEMNRREFLTLTGAAVVALSLAGCGGPSAPAAPTSKEAKVLKALNLYRIEKKLDPYQMDEGLNGLADVIVCICRFQCQKLILHHFNILVIGHLGLAFINNAERKPGHLIQAAELYIHFRYLKAQLILLDVAQGKFCGFLGQTVQPYDEDIEVMKNKLLALEPADTNDNNGPADVKLVGIKVFTAKDGKLYWVATGANSKKTA